MLSMEMALKTDVDSSYSDLRNGLVLFVSAVMVISRMESGKASGGHTVVMP